MECPICFNEYNENEYEPLKTFCRCQQTLCRMCLEQMVQFSNVCPWDKTRWTGRNLLKKFIDCTPKNYLEIRKQIQMSEDIEKSKTTKTKLSEEPTAFEHDKSLALRLQEEEASKWRRLQIQQEEEDLKLAMELSLLSESSFANSSSSSASSSSVPEKPRKRTMLDEFLRNSSTESKHLSHKNPLNYYSSVKKPRIEHFLIEKRENSRKSSLPNNSIDLSGDGDNEADEDIAWVCRTCNYENFRSLIGCEYCGNG